MFCPLPQQVFSEYFAQGGDGSITSEEKLFIKFNKKVMKNPKFKVHKEMVQLKHWPTYCSTITTSLKKKQQQRPFQSFIDAWTEQLQGAFSNLVTRFPGIPFTCYSLRLYSFHNIVFCVDGYQLLHCYILME